MDFADFYRATSPRMLRYAYGLTGDLPLAQDVTQEAYARAWQRWRSVSRHHDVEAWLRVVVTRLVYDWWRRLGVHRNRAEQPQPVPPPSEDPVVLSSALKRLPRAQAQALALHYLLDLPISQIAAEAGVAEGTVKSWLSRGRTGLADLLREEPPTVGLSAVAEVQHRGARRRRTRVIVAVVIGLAMIAGLAVWGNERHAQPVTPSPSPVAPHRTMQRFVELGAGPGEGPAAGVAIAGGRGYAARTKFDTYGNAATVTAIDLASGRKLWTSTGVRSSVDQFYVSSDVVVVLGAPGGLGIGASQTKTLTALGPDGQVLWRKTTTEFVELFPFRNVLAISEHDKSLAGLYWRTGEVAWQRPSTATHVIVMHGAEEEMSEAVRPVTESGKLLETWEAGSEGHVTEVDVATGRDVRSWTWALPGNGVWRSGAAYEGKLYMASDNRLITVDLGGNGPVVDYTEPAGIIESPVPCFRIFVCVTVGRSVRAIRGHDVLFRHDNWGLHVPMTAGDSMMVPLQSEYGEFVTVRRDPAGMWHTTQHQGDPLWMDDAHLLLSSRDNTIVDVDLQTGADLTLGRLDSGTVATATDGQNVLAATNLGTVAVYRLTPSTSVKPAP